jgi:hypothetical protein
MPPNCKFAADTEANSRLGAESDYRGNVGATIR